MTQTGELGGLGSSCLSVHLGWVLYIKQLLSSICSPQSAGPIPVHEFSFFVHLFLLLVQVREISLSSLEFGLPISLAYPLVPGETASWLSLLKCSDFPGLRPAGAFSRPALSV